MLFDIVQIPLMGEDFLYRKVTLSLCVVVGLVALYQGGLFVAYGAAIGGFCAYPLARKNLMGVIDGVFLGVYIGLLGALSNIAIFLTLTGLMGLLWHFIKRAPAPLIFLMGISYFFTKCQLKFNCFCCTII